MVARTRVFGVDHSERCLERSAALWLSGNMFGPMQSSAEVGRCLYELPPVFGSRGGQGCRWLRVDTLLEMTAQLRGHITSSYVPHQGSVLINWSSSLRPLNWTGTLGVHWHKVSTE